MSKIIVLVLFLSLTASDASLPKIEKIISVLGYQAEFHEKFDYLLPSLVVDRREGRAEFFALHQQRRNGVVSAYKQHLDWDVRFQEMKSFLENDFTPQEVHAIYKFISSKYGATTLKKIQQAKKTTKKLEDLKAAIEVLKAKNIEALLKDMEQELFQLTASLDNYLEPQESELLSEFINSNHGASAIEKLNKLDDLFRDSMSFGLEQYNKDVAILNAKYQEGLNSIVNALSPEDSALLVTNSGREDLRFMVAQDNGEMVGYRVRPRRRAEGVDNLLFLEGDIIISINGISISEPRRVRELYQLMKTITLLHFVVVRQGELIDIIMDGAAHDPGYVPRSCLD